MPHRILNKHAATSVVGLISYDVGTALDMSSAGMLTPSPPPEDIIQGSACFFFRNNSSVPKLITVPTLPLMPHLSRIRPTILEEAGVEASAVGTALEELKCRTALFMT